ncbi:MAG: ABC transporter permease, partial [Mesotoga sp.]|nr:ABC transporter permease [Mesotoga sp.]
FVMGALFGVVAGILITTWKISAFIAALALGTIATGINFMFTRGQEVYGIFPDSFLTIAQGRVMGIPIQVFIMAAVVLIFAFVMEKTKMGKWMYSIGGSVKASFLSGINVRLLRVVGMIISGALAAFTGCILASRLGSGQPTAGDAYLMDAIAASFLGMTAIKVGRPNVLGTFVGALIIGVINNGLVIMGVSYFFQYIAKGAIIILAVALTSFKNSESF